MLSYRSAVLVAILSFLITPHVLAMSAPTTNNTGSFTVSWSAANADSYYLKQSKDGGGWSTIYTGSGLSKALTGLANGSYQYKVVGKFCWSPGWCQNSDLEGPLTTVVALKPGVPASISATPAVSTNGSHTVSWGAASGSVTQYELYQSINGGSYTLWQSSLAFSKSFSGLTGGSYSYQVRACKTVSTYTSCSNFRTASTVTVDNLPGVPGPINGPASDNDGVFGLSWTAPPLGQVDRYEVEQQINGGSWGPVPNRDINSAAASYTVNTNGNSGTYNYRVRACNSWGCGGDTAVKSVSVIVPLPAPSIPDGLTVPSDDADNDFDVTWDSSTGTVHNYVLQQRKSKHDGTWMDWENVETRNVLAYNALGHGEGIYQYRVRACNVDNCSLFSPIKQITSHALVGLGDEPVVVNADTVGNTPYSATVSPSGVAAISVPIQVAPGINGLQPQLSVQYNSGRGGRLINEEQHEDTLGYGFRLSGFSQIRRCVVGRSDVSAVALTNADSLCLDGEPLVLVHGSPFQPGAIYAVNRGSYSRVDVKGTVSEPWFEVKTTDGRVHQYGATLDSRVKSKNTVGITEYFQWSINQVTDAFGNSMTYSYYKDELAGINYPLTINYGGASVAFTYLERDDTLLVDFAHIELDQMVRVHTVKVSMNGTVVRDYRLMSEVATQGWHRLTHVQQCGYDESGSVASCAAPLVFDWMDVNDPTPELSTVVYKLTDGLGAVTEFEHAFITEGGTNFMLFDELPFGAAMAPANATALSSTTADDPLKCVVTKLHRDNGLGARHTTEYAYQGTGFNSDHNWGFLGFYAQRVTDMTSGIVSYQQRRLDVPYQGRTSAFHQYNGVYGSHSEVLSKVETAYSKHTVTHGSGQVSDIPYMARRTQFTYEGGIQLGASVETNTYRFDGDGFLMAGVVRNVQTGTGISTPSHSPAYWGDVASHTLSGVLNTTESDLSFSNDTSGDNWVIGFSDSLDLDHYDGLPGGTGVEKRSTSATFTSVAGTLVVDSSTRFPGDADNELTTSFSYDSYGNRIGTTVVGANVASRSSTLSNFSHSRYPGTLTNALSHATTVDSYDVRFGAAKQVTDANGLVASVAYDAFGRIVSNTDVDGVTTSVVYESCSLVVCDAVGSVTPSYRVASSSPIAPTTMHYYDRIGRLIRSETQAFDPAATAPIVRDFYYDNLGRLDHYSLPYEKGGVAYSITRVYDIRNRVTSEYRPDGGNTTVAYQVVGGNVQVTHTETVKAADGTTTDDTQVKVSTFNLLGQLTSTTDASGTANAVTTNYTYDAQGNLKTATVDGGSDGSTTTTMHYDTAGNRKQLVGPNVGTITTSYTALGQLWTNTDNKGQQTTYAYDLLGRPTQRSDADGTASWVYDAAGVKGLLSSRSNGSGSNSFTETYNYSGTGRAARLATITTDIVVPGYNKQYVRGFSYDSYGRLDTASLPSGMTTRQQYNSRGYLSAIVNNATSQALQTFNQADQFGVTQETYGNGVVTNRSYDQQTGRIETIDTTVSGTVIQDLDYAWRSNGSLQHRFSTTDGGTVREERFSYDALNRLQQAKTLIDSNPQRDLDYSYNKLGNLLTKTSTQTSDTQVTGYQYGTTTNAGPHAVSQASINGSSVTLNYDLNGAITHYARAGLPDTFIDYNAANKPSKIVVGSSINDTNPAGKDEFSYGPDGERYYKKATYLDGSSTQQIEHTFYVGSFEETVLATNSATDNIKKSRIGQNILHIVNTPTLGTSTESMEYLHRDHLGSVTSITGDGGVELQAMAFEPYGARRNSDWLSTIGSTEMQAVLDSSASRTSRGYTGHEHLDRTGFIHMNGRVYDPFLGRFLSPDPLVVSPTNSQSWNRYSYVSNSPLSFTDPSGYISEILVTGSGPEEGEGGEIYINISTMGRLGVGSNIGFGAPDFENHIDNELKNCANGRYPGICGPETEDKEKEKKKKIKEKTNPDGGPIEEVKVYGNECNGILSCSAIDGELGGVGRSQREGIFFSETVKWGVYKCSCSSNNKDYKFVGPGGSFDDLRGVTTQHTPYKQYISPFEVDMNSGFDQWRYETFIDAFENDYQSIPDHLK